MNNLNSYCYFLLIRLIKPDCTDSCIWVGVFVSILFLAVLSPIFFFFSRSIETLRVIRVLRGYHSRTSGFFFYSKIFCWLRLSFSRDDVHWLVAWMALLINVLTNRGLYLGFDFGSCCSFNQSVIFIKLLVFFINPIPNKWPETFIEVLI